MSIVEAAAIGITIGITIMVGIALAMPSIFRYAKRLGDLYDRYIDWVIER